MANLPTEARRQRAKVNYEGGFQVNGQVFNTAAVTAVAGLDQGEIDAIVAAADSIAALETAVGTYSGGSLTNVAADVGTLQTRMGAYTGGSLTNVATNVDALQTTVGGAGSGLVKAVDDLETAVGTYGGGADISTDLSGVVSTVGDEQAGLVADVDALETAVGTYAGGADISTDLSGVVSTVGDAQAGLVADVDALETAVGTYGGGADISTDLSGVVSTVGDAQAGLVADVTDIQSALGNYSGENDVVTDVATLMADRTTSLVGATMLYIVDTTVVEGLTDDDVLYTYNSTPSGNVTVDLNATAPTATELAITPGGATAHAVAFTMLTTKTATVIKCTYDKGTHTGTLTIGGIVVSGSGTLWFGWDKVTSAYKNIATQSCTIVVGATATSMAVPSGLMCPGTGVTLTFELPATRTTEVFSVTGTIAAVDGTIKIGDLASAAKDADGVLWTFQWVTGDDEYQFTDTIVVPDGTTAVYVAPTANTGTDVAKLTLTLPTNPVHLGRCIMANSDIAGTLELDITLNLPGMATHEDVDGVWVYLNIITDPTGIWMPINTLSGA